LAHSFYVDASSLVKRYVVENGTALVNDVLNTVAAKRIYLVNVCAGEVVSILVRKKNSGAISPSYFGQAMRDFDAEIVKSADVHTMSVTNRLAASSFPLIIAHSINATDAITLKSALSIARRLRKSADDLVLVSSDQRLLRAAQAEGLMTFNPEVQDQAALAAHIGA
jgi:predicted nucleic acid-binding protein